MGQQQRYNKRERATGLGRTRVNRMGQQQRYNKRERATGLGRTREESEVPDRRGTPDIPGTPSW